jgi:hypothetical protein
MPIKTLDNVKTSFYYKLGLDCYLIVIYLDGSVGIVDSENLLTISINDVFLKKNNDKVLVIDGIKIGLTSLCEMPIISCNSSSDIDSEMYYLIDFYLLCKVSSSTTNNITSIDEVNENTKDTSVLIIQECDNLISLKRG